MPKSLEQILGGYATDTLTEEENRQLMEAALHDQELFDVLADEEALKALLSDPKTRQRILASLEESKKTLWVAKSDSSWFRWFRQPSSLAWVGSIAAMGLALIFGWQMQKEWGSIVQQEEQAERAMTEDSDSEKKEMPVRSQKPEFRNTNTSSPNSPSNRQSTGDRVAGLSSQGPVSHSPSMTKTDQDPERLRQSLEQVRSDDFVRKEVKKERRSKAKASPSRDPESANMQHVLEGEGKITSALEVPGNVEKSIQQAARSPSFADKLEGDVAISSPSRRKSIDAKKGQERKMVGKAVDGKRSRQLLGGAASQAKKAETEAVAGLKETAEAVQKDTAAPTKGIRYRFIQQTQEGKDTIIDPSIFSGKWSDLQLKIDSNVAGHLYVLTSYGNGKWQWMKPLPSNFRISSDGALNVKPYQAITFALSQVTNRLGKPVVPSVTVLFSSSALEVKELGTWLGGGIGSGRSEENLTQQRSKENFISDPALKPGNPLRVTIDLKGETSSKKVLNPMPANEFSR